eukprot:4092098-Pyramimonas_sp.AAC.2
MFRSMRAVFGATLALKRSFSSAWRLGALSVYSDCRLFTSCLRPYLARSFLRCLACTCHRFRKARHEMRAM